MCGCIVFSVTSCVNGWIAVIFQSAAPGGIGGRFCVLPTSPFSMMC